MAGDNLQPQAIGLIFAFPALATVAVALRLYSRTLTKSFGAGQTFIFSPLYKMLTISR